jgi:hypothetical protein
MEDQQKLAELFQRYPSLKKAFETGVEVIINSPSAS